MDTIRQDIRYAFRSLGMRRGFTIIAVTTLALGIGATTSIFSVVRGVLLRPLPFPESDRIVQLWETGPERALALEGGLLSHPNMRDIQAEAASFEAVAQYSGGNLTVSIDDAAELVSGARVTPAFFRVFRARLIAGREFTADEDRFRGPNVAIVSEGWWRERLGARDDVIGSTMRINGDAYTVVGIAGSGFAFPNDARIWIPGQNDDESCGRGCTTRQAVARLAAGATVEQARAETRALAQRLEQEYPDSNTDKTITLASLRDVIVGDVRGALLVLLGAVVMVLLIACANVANLLLVRGRGRAAEIAVRATLGADRGRIVSQLLTESVLLALAGGVAGIILSAWGVEALRSLAPANLPRLDEVGLDVLTLGFAALLSAATALLFGLAPALQLSSVDLSDTLRQGGRGEMGAAGSRFSRSAFLTAEVALSVVLLLAAGLMIRTLVRMNSVDLGFDPSGITQFRLSLPDARYEDPDAAVQFMDRVRERLAALPGMEQVAVMVAPPLGTASMFGNFARTDRPDPLPGEAPSVDYRIADHIAMDMLGIRITSGRGFEITDRHGSQPVALISRTAAERYFPGEDPIGRQIDMSISAGYDETDPRTIVGVFEDVRSDSPTTPPEPAVYIPYAQSGASFPNVLLRGRMDPAQIIAASRREVQALDAEIPLVRPGVMDEFVARHLAQPRFYMLLLGLFAFLALVLAAVGVYGVVAYAVSQRTREIGVRMALGAQVRQVISLVLWQGMRPAATGVIIGIIAALASRRLIAGLLFDIEPTDPVTFVLVPIVLSGVVILACALPARRATRIPPATALRG